MGQKIFGTSGIRGAIESKVTVDLALGLGRALGSLLKGHGAVGVGTDARTSRDMLRGAFVSGLVSTGVDVIDLGIAPMPTVAYYSSVTGISASVIITASHNPSADNGFKFFQSGREFIRSEEEFLETRIYDRNFINANWQDIGEVRRFDIGNQYLERVREFVLSRGGRGRGTRILVDAANGAAADYTPHLLRKLGFAVTTVNAHQDGHFPGRPAEPSPKNLKDTMKMTADSDFSVALCHDGDGDRLAVIDEDGKFIDQNRIIALFARDEVRRRGEGTVVVSIDTSSVIDEVVRAEGGQVERAPLGSLQEILAVRTDVVFASEPWKPIFTELGCWMDGVTGSARFAQMMDEMGDGSCIKLMKSIPEYPILRDNIPCPDKIKPQFISMVKEMLVPEISDIEQILEEDGIRIERKDGSYLLVRVSGTEPKARVYIGAKTQATLDKLARLSMDIMKQAVEAASK
jgi:phosphomannomutase